MIVEIVRLNDNSVQTTGELSVYTSGGFLLYQCKTLELSWNGNMIGASCIPKGKYKVVRRYSEKYKHHFHVLNVKDRSFILIHPANYYSQLKGCIAVGKELLHINNDSQLDVSNSKSTMSMLLDILPEEFDLIIKTEKDMKRKDVAKNIWIGLKEILPHIKVKENKEDDKLNEKGKLNVPRLIGNIVSFSIQAILAAKGITVIAPDEIDTVINFILSIL